MCGIIGYVGKRRAAPVLLECLKRLEYRGYDSAGIATLNNGEIFLKKDKGFIQDIEANLKLSDMPGETGIGHTRWATHGVPSMRNAHPHTSCDNKIAVAHNGIIENYLEIKNDLHKKGHKFSSETDTEVFAHLIEENLGEISDFPTRRQSLRSKAKGNFEQAVVKSLKKIRGSYAFAILNTAEPDKIIAARNKAPLIIGLGDGGNFVASDIPAFLNETRRALILENGEYAVLSKDGVAVKEIKSGKIMRKKVQEIFWSAEAAEKAGYDFFALKEINEIPRATEDTLAALPEIEKIAKQIKKFKKIIFVAAGTSYHAALIGKYLFENLCEIQCEAVLASEFSCSLAKIVDKKTLIIAISQSGETADTLLAIEHAKSKGAKILAISNVIGSSITRDSNFSIHTNAGPEIAVIATKTFATQLIVLYALAFYLAGKNPAALRKIPGLQEKTLSNNNAIKDVAEKIKDSKDVYFLGRGISYPLILEGALKLKEISYIHAEGMPAGELKHGTLSLIEENVPVVFALTPEARAKTISNMQEVKARGGFVIAITNEKDNLTKEHADIVIKVPELENPLLYPLLQILPLQLLAYHTTILRGLSPDKPRNLAKSVTVE